MKNLQILPEYKRNGIIFRGTPAYREKPWRDWAMFDRVGQDGHFPGHIWCFVVIETEPFAHGQGQTHGGIDLAKGSYAVVERGYFVDDESAIDLSSIFRPFKKEVASAPQGAQGWKRKFYLANLDALLYPLAVVPDIGCEGGLGFFTVKRRGVWANTFGEWIAAPIPDDVIGPEEPMPSSHT